METSKSAFLKIALAFIFMSSLVFASGNTSQISLGVVIPGANGTVIVNITNPANNSTYQYTNVQQLYISYIIQGNNLSWNSTFSIDGIVNQSKIVANGTSDSFLAPTLVDGTYNFSISASNSSLSNSSWILITIQKISGGNTGGSTGGEVRIQVKQVNPPSVWAIGSSCIPVSTVIENKADATTGTLQYSYQVNPQGYEYLSLYNETYKLGANQQATISRCVPMPTNVTEGNHQFQVKFVTPSDSDSKKQPFLASVIGGVGGLPAAITLTGGLGSLSLVSSDVANLTALIVVFMAVLLLFSKVRG